MVITDNLEKLAVAFFSTEGLYEGTSKSFRTFIFSRETVRAGGVVIGRV
jgi:hypothetical protein